MHNAFNAMNGAAAEDKNVVIQNVVCACALLRGRTDTVRDLDGPALAAMCARSFDRSADGPRRIQGPRGVAASRLDLSKSSSLRLGLVTTRGPATASFTLSSWPCPVELSGYAPSTCTILHVPADVGSAASGRTDEQD